MNDLNAHEIAGAMADTGIKKAARPLAAMFILAVLAGGFIALASEASNMAAHGFLARPETFGLGKFIAGLIFPVGLMLVVVAGGELFTGNTLMVMALAEKKITWRSMLRNWLVVYGGNFAGSILVAGMIAASGQLMSGAGLLGGVTLKIAAAKTSLSFAEAFWLGILCNWLVCLAVWMAAGARTVTGKLFACFFPIWMFITSGFEHCVANMYYIPAGLFIKSNELFITMSGLAPQMLNDLTWTNFLFGNLVPVTLGNIVGGSVFVGMAYRLAFLRKA